MKNFNLKLYALLALISILFLMGCSQKTSILRKQKNIDKTEISTSEKTKLALDLSTNSNSQTGIEIKKDVRSTESDSNKTIITTETKFNIVPDQNGNPVAVPSSQTTRTESWHTNKKSNSDKSNINKSQENKSTSNLNLEATNKKELDQKNDLLSKSKTDSTNKAPDNSPNNVKDSIMSYFVLIVGGCISLFFIFLYIKSKR